MSSTTLTLSGQMRKVCDRTAKMWLTTRALRLSTVSSRLMASELSRTQTASQNWCIRDEVLVKCTNRQINPKSISSACRSSAVSSDPLPLPSAVPWLVLGAERRWTITLAAYNKLGTTLVSEYVRIKVSSASEFLCWSMLAQGMASSVAIRSTSAGLALTFRRGATTMATRFGLFNVCGFSMASSIVPSRNSAHSSFSRALGSDWTVAGGSAFTGSFSCAKRK